MKRVLKISFNIVPVFHSSRPQLDALEDMEVNDELDSLYPFDLTDY
jgi:hypothetical protein